MIEQKEIISQMDNVELFDYLHSVPGHFSEYSSLYTYLAKHPPMDNYYREFFKGINLKGKLFLDLGPGVGASLDVAKEIGAKTYFIDRDIFIGKYCENKGHTWYELDYFNLPIRDIGFFDFVLSRGSLNVDMMNRTNFDIRSFLKWLTKTGKTIVVIPTWDKGEVIHGEDYTCVGEHLDRYLASYVHNSFIEFDFSVTFNLSNVRFPITYERLSTI